MKRYDPRLWFGGLLILGGVLALLENFNIISDVGDVFWGLIFAAAGAYFLQRLFMRREWWAAFPGFVLLGLALSMLLPQSLDMLSGLIFFAGLGIAFLWVYFSDTARWWAIIPAGVMFTLGTVSLLSDITDGDTGGYFFIGLGLTFILVTLLPGGGSRTWALIPGAILLVFGAVISTPLGGFTQYLIPGLLILLGVYILGRVFMRERSI
jgi:hypothetical protein